MRIATYTRISTDEAHQPYSLEAQATRLGSYVDSQEGWELVRTFSDQASGATTERPGLERALAAARAQRYDLLLVYRVDRFARSVRGLASLLEAFDAAGVAFRSATEPFDTATPAGRMMVQMLGVFAEFERATIIDRVIAGMERRRPGASGAAGHAPTATSSTPQAGTSSLTATRPLSWRSSSTATAASATARRPSPPGSTATVIAPGPARPWNHMAVLTVLRNRAYLGEVYFRDTYHPAPHPPLIDPDTFDLAQQILRLRSEDYAHRASNASDYLLAGLITCTRCGKGYIGTAAHGNEHRYRYYTCFSRQRYGTATCSAERSPPTSWRAKSAGRCFGPSAATTSSRLRSRPVSPDPLRSAASTKTNSAWSTPNWPSPKKPSNGTCSPSRPAPSPRPPAGNESRPSLQRSPPCKPVGVNWPRFSMRSKSSLSPKHTSNSSAATSPIPSSTVTPVPKRASFKRSSPESRSKAGPPCARTSGYRSTAQA